MKDILIKCIAYPIAYPIRWIRNIWRFVLNVLGYHKIKEFFSK